MLFSGLSSELFPDELVVRDDFLLVLACAGAGGKGTRFMKVAVKYA